MEIYLVLCDFHKEIKNLLIQLKQDPLNLELFNVFKEKLEIAFTAEEEFFYKPCREKLGRLSVVIDISEEEHIIAKKLIELYSLEDLSEKKSIILLMIKKVVEAHLDKEQLEVYELSKDYFTTNELQEMAQKLKQWIKEILPDRIK